MHKALATVILVALAGVVSPAAAQFWPAYSYGYGGWGGYPYGGAAVRSAWEQDRQTGQEAAMAQNYAVQSGIRNTLMSQAQTQTQNILGQRQANQDWWFQHQQQQLAERQAGQFRAAAPVAGLEPGPQGAPPPKAATDIIKWPPLLEGPRFAAERARIEAPYRRSAQGLSPPTAADFDDMVKAAAQIRTVLKGMTAEISARDYLNTEAFLDQLAAEAEQDAAKLRAPRTPEAKETK